jgi:hypothetical protein
MTHGPFGSFEGCIAYMLGMVGAPYIANSSAQTANTLDAAFRNPRMRVFVDHWTPVSEPSAIVITFDDRDHERLAKHSRWAKVQPDAPSS